MWSEPEPFDQALRSGALFPVVELVVKQRIAAISIASIVFPTAVAIVPDDDFGNAIKAAKPGMAADVGKIRVSSVSNKPIRARVGQL